MSNLATITNNILADSGIDDINVVVTNGSYANPAWITSLDWSKITNSPLGNYLPLAGGTMTGAITTPNGTFGIIVGDDSRLADRNVANTLFLEGVQNNDRGYINFSQTSGNQLGAVNGGALTWRGDTVWTSGNITPVTGTGTTNFLPKFTGSTTIGNSQIFDNGTSVDIGSPTTVSDIKLNVNGAGRFVSNGSSRALYLVQNAVNAGNIIQFQNQSGTDVWEIVGRNHQFYIYNTALGVPSLFINPLTNNLSIGSFSDNGARLQVSGTAQISGTPPSTNGGLLNIRDSVTATNVISFAGVFFNSSPGNDYSIGKLTENGAGFLQIRNANSGTELLRINSTGAATFSSSVTVGEDINLSRASSPAIVSTTNQAIRLVTNGFTAQLRTDGVFANSQGFRTDGFIQAVNLAVGASFYNTAAPTNGAIIQGNVGIGTTSITASRLRVEGATSEANSIADFISNDTTASATYHRGIRVLAPSLSVGDKILMSVGVADNTRNMGQLYFNYVGNGSASNYLSLGLFAVDEVLNITGAGNVLIGTTSDNGYLLRTGDKGTSSTNAFFGTGTVRIGGGADAGFNQVLSIAPGVVGVDAPGIGNGRFVVNGSGNVGIGAPNPNQRLDVRGYIVSDSQGNGSESAFYLGNSSHGLSRANLQNDIVLYTTSGDVRLSASTASTSHLIVKNNGNVLIGTTTDVGDKLVVSASIGGNGNIFATGRITYSVGFSSYTPDGLFSASAVFGRIFTPSGNDRIRFGYFDQGGGQYWGRIGFQGNTDWSLGTAAGGDSFVIGVGNGGGGNLTINNAGAATFSNSLQVNGGSRLIGSATVGVDTNQWVLAGQANGGAIFQKSHSGAGGFDDRYLRLGNVDNNGNPNYVISIINSNTGFGTTNPTQRIHIDGQQGQPATGGTTQNGLLRIQGGGGVGYGETLDMGFHVGVSGPASYGWLQSTNTGNLGINYNLALNPNGGNVLIGTTTANGNRLRVNGTIFSDSSVTATSFFESSDSSLKTLVEDNYQAKGIDSVVAKLYIKNGKQELGYYAQDLQEVLPSAVSKGSDGLLNLSYREVHTAKIAYLEERIKQLEKKYENN